jgi:phage gp29-like protein
LFFRTDLRRFQVSALEGPVVVVPGDGQWVLHAPYGAYRGWMRGAVRSCAIPYISRAYAWRDWNRYSEVHGMPIKLLKFPESAGHDEKQAVAAALAKLQTETAIGLPQAMSDSPGADWDLTLLEATANTWQGFRELLTKAEERIAIRILGQNLTTNVDGGSLAAANTHDRVRLDYVRFDARSLASTIRTQILMPFAAYNFGDPDLAPSVTWDVDPAEDQLARSQAVATLVQAAALAESAYDVDARELLRQGKVPLRDAGTASAARAAGEAAKASQPDAAQEAPYPGSWGGAGLSKRMELDSRATARADGDYVDALAASAAREAARSLGPLLRELVAIVRSGAGYSEVRAELLRAYPDLDSAAIADIMSSALAAAALSGAASVPSPTEEAH